MSQLEAPNDIGPLRDDAAAKRDVEILIRMLRDAARVQLERALDLCRQCGVKTP
jgi:hypothetical protein